MFTHSKVRLSCDFKSKHKTWVSKSNTTMAKWARQFNREITVWDQHPQFQMDAGTQQQNQQRKIEKKWLNEAIAKCASGDVHFSAEIVSAFHRKSNLLDSNCCVWICIPASQPKLSTEWTLFKRRNIKHKKTIMTTSTMHSSSTKQFGSLCDKWNSRFSSNGRNFENQGS